MKLGKHGKFLFDFVMDFSEDKIDRWEFDLDYSGHMIAYFPNFEKETPRLAAKFAKTVDLTYFTCTWMTDEELAFAMSDALDDFLGTPQLPDLY